MSRKLDVVTLNGDEYDDLYYKAEELDQLRLTHTFVPNNTYADLISDSETLEKLHAAGVDNCVGYDLAFED